MEGQKPADESDGSDEKQWQICIDATISAPANKVWSFVGRFCDMHIWWGSLEICERVEGFEGVPGCVRYCAGGMQVSDKDTNNQGHDNDHEESATEAVPRNWSKERLVLYNSEEMMLSYSILDSSFSSLKNYLASFQVIQNEDHASDQPSCILRWNVQLDPVPLTCLAEFAKFFEIRFHTNIQKLQNQLLVMHVPIVCSFLQQ